MDLGVILIVLLVIAGVFWLVSKYVPDPFRWIIITVLAVGVVLWLLNFLGATNVRMDR